MAKSEKSRVVLIDGHSLLHRAYHALPALTTVDGQPTHAVYGFATMLLRLIDDVKPEYIAIALDRPSPTFRHETYQAYKADRPRMPDDLRVQIPVARELIEALNIPIFEVDGYEGDDVVGTLARIAADKGLTALIVTGDKDALQLVNDRVRVLLTKKGIRDMETYDAERVRDETGVAPTQITDLKGLVGDKSDNIPGVPGIGAKTAARLLNEYASLEDVLRHAGDIPGKTGASLRAHRADAEMSKVLATIDRAVPITVDWDRLRRREPQLKRLAELYRGLEFRTLLEKLIEAHPVLAEASQARGGGDLDDGAEPPPEVHILRSVVAARQALDSIPHGAEIVVDAAWLGGRPGEGNAVGLGLAFRGAAYYIPWEALGNNAPGRIEQGPVAEVLRRSAITCHDVKFLLLTLDEGLASSVEIKDDVMIQGYLCAPGQGDHSIEDLAVKYGVPAPTDLDEAIGAADTAQQDTVAQAMAERLHAVGRLRQTLADRLERDGLVDLYRDIELPLVRVLASMERCGIRLDVDLLHELSEQFGGQIARLEKSIFARAGEEFNLNSPKQLATVLFDRLGLPVLRKTKSGPSTSAEVLESLAEEHDIVSEILEYRQAQKLKSTYADALPALVRPDTGRVHTSFNQAVAATGRLSSAHPNLQNIPVRTEAGRRIRRAFLPRSGYVLLKADYSQIELRVLAHIAKDETLIQAFREGTDIHTQTAAEVFGISPAEVTREKREAAKAINFGIVYGISGFGLARGTGLTIEEAKAFIARYLDRYPQVSRYMQESVASARERGYVSTLFGRRRYLPDINSRNWNRRKFAERTAINTPIQGSAADIIKSAMVTVHRRLQREGAPAAILLQVHDELVLECDEGARLDVARLLKEAMESVVRLDAPLRVEIAAGPNWLDGERMEI